MQSFRIFFIALSVCCQLLANNQYSAKEYVAVDPFASAKNPCTDIQDARFLCLDCETLAFCTQNAGEWHVLELGTCETGRHFYCDEQAKGCTLQSACSGGMKFECQNPGMYPDPYNCKYYHECNSRNQDTRYICPSGWAYSVADNSCNLFTTNAICSEPQYKCDSIGARAAWPGEPNIFYVCFANYENGKSMLYPNLFRCPQNQIFDGDRCVYVAAAAGPATTAASVPTAGDASGVVSTAGSTLSEACVPNKLVADPTDCQAYFICRSGEWVPAQCAVGANFNAVNGRCEMGACRS